MYSKHEASKLKQEFWTKFGQYMKPVLSAAGETINWVNYKTGIPHIYFRMRAENNYASISIELTHPSSLVQQDQFEQLEDLRSMFQQAAGAAWVWQKNAVDENGKHLGRISIELPNVSVFREADWPAIISFLKAGMIGLDTFWNDVKPAFE